MFEDNCYYYDHGDQDFLCRFPTMEDNESKLKDVIKVLIELHTVYVEQFTEAVAKSGKSDPDYLRDSFSHLAYNGAYTILTTGDARQIIDALTK